MLSYVKLRMVLSLYLTETDSKFNDKKQISVKFPLPYDKQLSSPANTKTNKKFIYHRVRQKHS